MIGSLSGRLALYDHLTSPDLASKATTSEGGRGVKMNPPTTSGVDSLFDPDRVRIGESIEFAARETFCRGDLVQGRVTPSIERA